MNDTNEDAGPSRPVSASTAESAGQPAISKPAERSADDEEEEEGMVRAVEDGQITEKTSSNAPSNVRASSTPDANARQTQASAQRDAVVADANSARTTGSRLDNHRRSYGSVSSTSSRGPDIYRPTPQDRDRDWGLARERDFDWAHERDAYRYRDIDARRDWDYRDRSITYDAADMPSMHGGHYEAAFDNRDYATHRGMSPASTRDFDTRSWERERAFDHTDPRSRSQSSARASRHGGWDNRSWGAEYAAYPPVRYTQTPPPPSNRASSARPAIGSSWSERGNARSRENSPRETRSVGHWLSPRHIPEIHREASPRALPQASPAAQVQPLAPEPQTEAPTANSAKSLLDRISTPQSTSIDKEKLPSVSSDKTVPPASADEVRSSSVSSAAAGEKAASDDAKSLTETPLDSKHPQPNVLEPAGSTMDDGTASTAKPAPEEHSTSIIPSVDAPTTTGADASPTAAAETEVTAAAVTDPSLSSEAVEAVHTGEELSASASVVPPVSQDGVEDMDVDQPDSQLVSAGTTVNDELEKQKPSKEGPAAPVTADASAEVELASAEKSVLAGDSTEAALAQSETGTADSANTEAVALPTKPQEVEVVQQPAQIEAETSAAAPSSSVSLPTVSTGLQAADYSTIAKYASAEEAERNILDSQKAMVHDPTPIAQDAETASATENAAMQAVPAASANSTEVDKAPKEMVTPELHDLPQSPRLDAVVEAVAPAMPTAIEEASLVPEASSEAPSKGDEQVIASADVSMAELREEHPAEDESMVIDQTVDVPIQSEAEQIVQPMHERGAVPSAQDSVPTEVAQEVAISPEPKSIVDTVVTAQARDLPSAEDGGIEAVEAEKDLASPQQAEDEPPQLKIVAMDEISKDVESPMLTPRTKEQIEMVTRAAIMRALSRHRPSDSECFNIIRENQKLAHTTTLDVMHARIHGIPLSVSEEKSVWLDEDDEDVRRTKSYLSGQMMDRQKRMNKKVEALKAQYKSINSEWKLHCARLDRLAERREQQQRRLLAATPAGTPAASAMDEPGNGGGGILGAALLTGRANRRSTQTGFAGFGDAVRSEAEFLEILASLENADMQDPNMRAARTTATAPDMQLDPYHNRPLEQAYDDVNGFVANPLAFYLDKFDPDVWTDEEKAIFARRYALWPKQFGKIAQALPHKTASQCVRYYYLNKKAPGNDFKALAAARNRERKRKARVKPKKGKGSALMADLKSAKGEELEEDDGGIGSPIDQADPSLHRGGDTSGTVTPRRGGGAARSRASMSMSQSESALATPTGEWTGTPQGKKRSAALDGRDSPIVEGKAGDKRRSTPKTKRAKTSDSAKLGDKFKKARRAAKQEALPDSPKPSLDTIAMQAEQPTPDPITESTNPTGVEESDLAAAEALGALASMFGSSTPLKSEPVSDTSFDRSEALTVDGELQKPGKKRKSKNAVSLPGQEEAELGSRSGRSKQPTSSYWSVAERSEFLRALALHGKHWDVVSSTLSQKSAAQARNYFARNGSEADFREAAALADKNHGLTLAEREAAATLFVRQRSAANAAQSNALPSQMTTPAGIVGSGADVVGAHDAPRTTYLPPPPALSSSTVSEQVEVKRREESPEPVTVRRGLQINSLLNTAKESEEARAPRRLSGQDWPRESTAAATERYEGREGSLPISTYSHRPLAEQEIRPSTAGEMEMMRPSSSDGRGGSSEGRPRMYEPFGVHRQSPGYANMAPPPHYPSERLTGSHTSRYSLPPSSAPPSLSRPASSHHLSADGETSSRSEHGRYSAAQQDYRETNRGESEPQILPAMQHASDSRHAYDGQSPANSTFPGGMHASYGRYSGSGASVGSMYSNAPRRTMPPLSSSTSERTTSDHRWHRPSESPGSIGSGAGPYSTGNTYRSAGHAYSNYPSQNLPRPSLPLSGSSGRSLPPLGSFPSSGARPINNRPRLSDESPKWPYTQSQRDKSGDHNNNEQQ